MKILVYLYWAVWRFFKALFTNKKLKVPNYIRAVRLNKCYGCPNLNKESHLFFMKSPRCKICGCYIKLKTHLAAESCPDAENQRWKEYNY